MSEFKLVPGEYRTRDGRSAVIHFRLSEPCNTNYVMTGEMQLACGTWACGAWLENGRFSSSTKCGSDLVPPVRYCYINVYARNAGGAYSSLEEADERTANDREGVLVAEIDLVGNIKWDTIGFMTRKGCVHA